MRSKNSLLRVRCVRWELGFGQLLVATVIQCRVIVSATITAIEEVQRSLHPGRAEVRTEARSIAHHVVESDIKVVLDIAPFLICEEVAEGGRPDGDGLVAAELEISVASPA